MKAPVSKLTFYSTVQNNVFIPFFQVTKPKLHIRDMTDKRNKIRNVSTSREEERWHRYHDIALVSSLTTHQQAGPSSSIGYSTYNF